MPMNELIANTITGCNTEDWQSLSIPYGEASLTAQVPPDCVTLRMQPSTPMDATPATITQALVTPIGSPKLSDIIAGKGKPPEQLKVCIAVSDITRPVPYKGQSGILDPLLRIVEATGVRRENIIILIGNGMHRPSTPVEREFMYGQDIVKAYRIVDHDCEDLESQVLAAHTSKGTEVHLNTLFYNADVKIVTGLVESHFMAGASGGCKGVCPALVNVHTLQKFHGVDFLEHPHATNLVLEGNPCHEEALEVAKTVGVDFLVNTTLDRELKLTGVFAGELEAAHQAAFEAIKTYVSIPITDPYDIVITHGGYVGRNHYQCAKAAVGAMPVVKKNGFILLVADNFDVEPVGGTEYRTLLHRLKILGPDGYVSVLRQPDWVFTKDQWEPQMWAKALRKVGPEGLVYCAPQVTQQDYQIIPSVTGYDLLNPDAEFSSMKDKAQAILQNAVKYAVAHPKWRGQSPAIAFVEEGPYAVPIKQ